jgi:hypothetical protein
MSNLTPLISRDDLGIPALPQAPPMRRSIDLHRHRL